MHSHLTFIFHACAAPSNQTSPLQHIQMHYHSKPEDMSDIVKNELSHSLYSILVNVSPPPWELSKRPLVMLHWGQPEVKTLINISPAQPGEERKALYLSGVLCSQEAVGEKEGGMSHCIFTCAENISLRVNRQIKELLQKYKN